MASLPILQFPPPAFPAVPEDAPGIDADALGVLRWTFTNYASRRIVATTSFGMEGCVLVDLISRLAAESPELVPGRVPVIYLDTHFFFGETHDLRRRMADRYPAVEFVNGGTDLTPDQQSSLYGPELWKTDSDACCRIRKVEPMARALGRVDVWLTALRRGQSAERAALPVVGHDAQYGVVKVCPLAGWTRPQVWQYVQEHGVPYNALHERGYPTVGCTHCTKAVEGSRPDDYTRAGRWAGTAKTECGLHQSPDGRLVRS